MRFAVRGAVVEDIPVIEAIVELAIANLMTDFLDAGEIAASRAIMGVDRELIADGTYFVVTQGEVMAGCGGWSRRATLFGGDATLGRSSRELDPATEPARIRAMYTHPQWVRRGLGRLVLGHCEAAARAAGFEHAELAATQAGRPLYAACGYSVIENWRQAVPGGASVPLTRMRKSLRV